MIISLASHSEVQHVTWVSINPHPITSILQQCPPVDWRFPHIIAGYNEIAYQMVESSHGQLDYLDLFSIAFHLFDDSFDGAHYQGAVGKALAKRVEAHVLEWHSGRGRLRVIQRGINDLNDSLKDRGTQQNRVWHFDD